MPVGRVWFRYLPLAWIQQTPDDRERGCLGLIHRFLHDSDAQGNQGE
jgi:hypothetical protein